MKKSKAPVIMALLTFCLGVVFNSSIVHATDSGIEASSTYESSVEIIEEPKSLEERLEDVKSSVVQINAVYIDDEKKHHIIKGAAGTLIGKKDGTEYVLTSMEAITPDKDLKNSALKALGVAKDKREDVDLSYEVVVENDMVFSATLLNSSEELDLGVFTISQPLNKREPMTILYSENGKGMSGIEDVYAFGFPDAIVYGTNDVYYANERVNRTSGKISNIVKTEKAEWIEHNAAISANNNGGPLVNPDGEMIGINNLKTEGTYYYSVSANSIVRVLDGLGIEYDKISIEEKARNAAAMASTVAVSTEEQLPVVVEKVPAWLTVVVILLVCVVAVVLVMMILIMKKSSDKGPKKPSFKERKKQQKEEKEKLITPETFENRRTQVNVANTGSMISNNDETSVLNAGASDETSVLAPGVGSDVAGVYGSLYRKQFGENVIINKKRFVIGKDSVHVDYSIKKNGAISRQHAAINVMPDGTYIEDLGSTNGTFVNNSKLSKNETRLLNDGDMIKLADEEFEYRK